MNAELFEKFLAESDNKLQGKSDSDKIRIFVDWCRQKDLEEVILRLSSEEKTGWSRNLSLDFTTKRIIITKRNILTKFADLGYVAGLAHYPSIILRKDYHSSKARRYTSETPKDLISSKSFCSDIWYTDIEEIILRRGIETITANMFGMGIVSNFLHVRISSGSSFDLILPVNKNGTYEQVHFWTSVVLPARCQPYYDNNISGSGNWRRGLVNNKNN